MPHSDSRLRGVFPQTAGQDGVHLHSVPSVLQSLGRKKKYGRQDRENAALFFDLNVIF